MDFSGHAPPSVDPLFCRQVAKDLRSRSLIPCLLAALNPMLCIKLTVFSPSQTVLAHADFSFPLLFFIASTSRLERTGERSLPLLICRCLQVRCLVSIVSFRIFGSNPFLLLCFPRTSVAVLSPRLLVVFAPALAFFPSGRRFTFLLFSFPNSEIHRSV